MQRAVAALAILLAGAGMASAGEEPAVLVELFTSQGCSSCPPADRILGEVAKRDDVVALSFHVDYWDYLGWRDTFADQRYSARQFAYRDAWRARVVYTPQMVVGGDLPVPGNDMRAVEDAIALAYRSDGAAALALEVGEETLTASARGLPGDAVVWAARYRHESAVAIERGENAGKTIAYHNIVTDLVRLGTAGTLTEPTVMGRPGPSEGVAIWAQGGDGHGRVLAVAHYEATAGH
ncbi:MAG: DUF1223 domain-containing protein [Pseudomonadota bacterium]